MDNGQWSHPQSELWLSAKHCRSTFTLTLYEYFVDNFQLIASDIMLYVIRICFGCRDIRQRLNSSMDTF